MEKQAPTPEQISAKINDPSFRADVRKKSGANFVVADPVKNMLIIVISDVSEQTKKKIEEITGGVPFILKKAADPESISSEPIPTKRKGFLRGS